MDKGSSLRVAQLDIDTGGPGSSEPYGEVAATFQGPIERYAVYPLCPARTLASILEQVEGVRPKVAKVIFNGPATVVFWDDGVKTVVKCRECGDGRCIKANGYERDTGEPAFARPFFCATHQDSEKALMAAILKRVYHGYQDVLREFVPEDGDE